MKRRSAVALAIGAVSSLAITAAIAAATPPAGVTPVIHVAGAALPDVKVNADKIKFQTKAPTDVSVLTLTLAPGGTTGWHSHPGFAVIAVAEGTGKLYFSDCSSKTFRAGQAFVEAGDDRPTLFRNETSLPVVVTVTFVAPKGAAIIRDEADPGCQVS